MVLRCPRKEGHMILAWQDARRKAQETLDHYWDGTFPVRV